MRIVSQSWSKHGQSFDGGFRDNFCILQELHIILPDITHFLNKFRVHFCSNITLISMIFFWNNRRPESRSRWILCRKLTMTAYIWETTLATDLRIISQNWSEHGQSCGVLYPAHYTYYYKKILNDTRPGTSSRRILSRRSTFKR